VPRYLPAPGGRQHALERDHAGRRLSKHVGSESPTRQSAASSVQAVATRTRPNAIAAASISVTGTTLRYSPRVPAVPAAGEHPSS
jgi:hypothetical protein